MITTWHTIKGYVAGTVAFVACPCHLPLTLPLLFVLTSGTAFGVWLTNNVITFGVILTVIFIGGLVLAFKWMTDTGANKPATIEGQRRRPKSSKTKARQSVSANGASHTGTPKVTLITSSTCNSCKQAATVWQQAREEADFEFETVDIHSAQGRDLTAKYNIFSTPASVINDSLVLRGTPKLEKALSAVNRNTTCSS